MRRLHTWMMIHVVYIGTIVSYLLSLDASALRLCIACWTGHAVYGSARCFVQFADRHRAVARISRAFTFRIEGQCGGCMLDVISESFNCYTSNELM